ncbi:MAG TPA: hypothetical protein VKA60_21140 [Blastocatellia bacterium]|nr:hypothetical protein [Blastocatellia bacterium]
MKKRFVHYQFVLCAVVICGLLAMSALSKSEAQALASEGVGKMIDIVSDPIAAVAQEQSERRPLESVPVLPTIGCCKCLGGTNGLDLSTVSFNNWIVKDSTTNSAWATAAFVTPVNSAWNLNSGAAKWISVSPNGGTGGILGHTYEYRLNFFVSTCAIEQRVTLTGTCGGDDEISVFIDNTTSANLLSQCTGGWCFNTSNPPPPFNRVVGAGTHTLIAIVKNGSLGPAGMFVNAKLTGVCVH